MNLIFRLSMTSLLFFFFSQTVLANAKQPNQPYWSQHTGAYLGMRMGYNTVDVKFYDMQESGRTVSQELMGGYMYTPYIGAEMGMGSYFSSLGLGVRGTLKAVYPVTRLFGLSAQVGAAYISTFLENGFVGPYLSVGMTFSLNPQIEVNISESDIISKYALGDTESLTANFYSLLVGFTYHVK